MATDETWAKRQEIPFGTCGLKYLLSIDADAFEYHRQFDDQRDINVALRVFDDLGRLCNFDARRFVCPGRDNRPVDLINVVGNLRRRA